MIDLDELLQLADRDGVGKYKQRIVSTYMAEYRNALSERPILNIGATARNYVDVYNLWLCRAEQEAARVTGNYLRQLKNITVIK